MAAMKAARAERAGTGLPLGAAAYLVLSRVRPLYQASGRAVAQELEGTDLTVPLRAVLEVLLRRGPQTVPQVAREFDVTRQSIQALVDSGASRGLLGFEDNPHHRRSRLVVVTEHGRLTFKQVHRRELKHLERVTGDLDATDLARCAEILALLTDRVHHLYRQNPTAEAHSSNTTSEDTGLTDPDPLDQEPT